MTKLTKFERRKIDDEFRGYDVRGYFNQSEHKKALAFARRNKLMLQGTWGQNRQLLIAVARKENA